MEELRERVVRLEERMETMKAEYKTDIAILARQLAERDTSNTRWLIGTIAVATVLIVAVLGLLIRWPG